MPKISKNNIFCGNDFFRMQEDSTIRREWKKDISCGLDSLSRNIRKVFLQNSNKFEKILPEHQYLLEMLSVLLEQLHVHVKKDIRLWCRNLYTLCEELEEGYKKGDLLSVTYVMQTFLYSIMTLHKGLLEADEKTYHLLIKEQDKKMHKHCQISQIFQKYSKLEQTMNKMHQEIQEKESQLQIIVDEISEYKKTIPLTVLAAGGFAGEPLWLANRLKKAKSLRDECKVLKTYILRDCHEAIGELDFCERMQTSLEQENLTVKEYFVSDILQKMYVPEQEIQKCHKILEMLYSMELLEGKRKKILEYQKIHENLSETMGVAIEEMKHSLHL